jgi:hypothetical protein
MKIATERTRVLAHTHPKLKTFSLAGWVERGGYIVPYGGVRAPIRGWHARGYGTKLRMLRHRLSVGRLAIDVLFWREEKGRRLVRREKSG